MSKIIPIILILYLLFVTSNQTTIFIAGDSTVKTYEDTTFLGGWGQYLSYYLKDNIEVINTAQGGRSSRSFINEARLYNIEGDNYKFSENGGKSIEDTIKAGDFLFIQFGHNDDASNMPKSYSIMVDRLVPLGKADGNGKYPTSEGVRTSTSVLPEEFVSLSTNDERVSALKTISSYGDKYYSYDCGGTYKWYLKQYIDFARSKNAIPVLVTPVSRVTFSGNNISCKVGGFGTNCDYIQAVRQLAQEEDCLLVDLHAMTVKLLDTVTKSYSDYLMALKPSSISGTWPSDYDRIIVDKTDGYTGIEGTHYNKYGAYIIAGFVAESILKEKDEVHNGKEYFNFADSVLTESKEYVLPSTKLPTSVIKKILGLFSYVKPL